MDIFCNKLRTIFSFLFYATVLCTPYVLCGLCVPELGRSSRVVSWRPSVGRPTARQVYCIFPYVSDSETFDAVGEASSV